MKKVEKMYPFAKANDYIFDVPIKDIIPGDKLIIADDYLLNETYFKVVTVPDHGLIITKAGNVLVEGKHTENFSIKWLPKFSNEYLGGLITFNSSESESFIRFFAQGEFEDDFISHLLKPGKDASLMVLRNTEKLKSFFLNLK